MANRWQLQDARNRLSMVVDEALEHGPQIITRRGREAVVVLSMEEYRKMASPDQNIVDFFKSSPMHGVDIDLTRSKDLPREVDL